MTREWHYKQAEEWLEEAQDQQAELEKLRPRMYDVAEPIRNCIKKRDEALMFVDAHAKLASTQIKGY